MDIRKQGSGNIGATNVFRLMGKSWGILCFFLDFSKGLTAASLPLLPMFSESLAANPRLPLLAGAAAIMGHNFPVWLKFKGGKGIATSGGVIAAVAPWSLLAGLSTWVLSMVLSRTVSLSSILAAVAVAVSAWMVYSDRPVLCGILTAIAAIAIYRHHANIGRLLRGEELRFGKRK